jgi:hypothetical protein
MTSNVAVLTLLDSNLAGFLGSNNSEAYLIVKVTMNTTHNISFENTFHKIKIVDCAISS